MPLLAASLAMMADCWTSLSPSSPEANRGTLLSPQRYTRMTIKQARMPFDLFEERGRVESTVTK